MDRSLGVSGESSAGPHRSVARPTNPRLTRLFLATVAGCAFAFMFDLITAKTWVVVTGVTILACVAYILWKACSPPARREPQPPPIIVVVKPSMITASANDQVLAAILKKTGCANLDDLPEYIGKVTLPEKFGDPIDLSSYPAKNIMRAKADGKLVFLIKLRKGSAGEVITQVLILQDNQWKLYSDTKGCLGLGMIMQGSLLSSKTSTGLVSILEGGSYNSCCLLDSEVW